MYTSSADQITKIVEAAMELDVFYSAILIWGIDPKLHPLIST